MINIIFLKKMLDFFVDLCYTNIIKDKQGAKDDNGYCQEKLTR